MELRAAERMVIAQRELVRSRTELAQLQRRFDLVSGDPTMDETTKQATLLSLLNAQRNALNEILALRGHNAAWLDREIATLENVRASMHMQARSGGELAQNYNLIVSRLERLQAIRKAGTMPLAIERHETDQGRAEELDKVIAELADLKNRMAVLTGQGEKTDFAKVRDRLKNQMGDAAGAVVAGRSPSMTISEGIQAGPMQWLTNVGSMGQQVANQIDTTIGESVRGVGQELANWAVTGKMSGDTLKQVGMSIFTGWVTQIVQMGVQWLVTQTLIKLGLISTDALQSALLQKKTAEVNAANAETLPGNTANAATASVSSFGLAAVIGIAALLAVMAMFGGFRDSGGAVAPGRAYIVGENRPEVFIPSTAGRIAPNVGGFTRSQPGFGSSAPIAAAKPRVYLMRPTTEQDFDEMRRRPEWDVHVVDTMMRHRGDLLNA